MALPITVVVPVKNEEKSLAACLTRLGAFEEIVVVDSQSTDKTCEIAAQFGARVVQFKWQGGFPKKRNWALLNLTFKTPWVLFLDADEQVTPAFVDEAARAVSGTSVAGFWLNYSNYFMGKMLRFGDPQRKLALLRVGAGLYERIEDPGWSHIDSEIHEHPQLTGEIGEIRARIDHLDVRGIEQFIDRHNCYSTWEANRFGQLVDAGEAGWTKLTRRQRFKYRTVASFWFAPAYFLFTYIFRLGFLDGMAGMDYALLKMAYFQNIRLKMIEIAPGK